MKQADAGALQDVVGQYQKFLGNTGGGGGDDLEASNNQGFNDYQFS